MRVIRHWIRRMKRKFNNIKELDAAIIFSTNVMNEQTENNKQTNCFLKIVIRKRISLPLEAIQVTLTGSSVKSAEHMANINTKIKLILLVALGQDKQKLWSLWLVLPQCDFCVPAWRIRTTWMASCKGPIAEFYVKQQLCTCSTFFCTFLCRHCTTTTWNYQVPHFG